MADIVCIAEETLNTKVNALGDVVDVVEDGAFTGTGAAGFQIIRVEGMTVKQVKTLLDAKIPAQKLLYSLPVNKGEWTEERPTEKRVWEDNDTWKELVVEPKFKISINTLSKDDIVNLADKKLGDKTTILDKCVDKISTNTENTKTTITIAVTVNG